MNAIKHFFIGLLLLSIPIISSGQDLKIDFSYNRQSNSLILHIQNNTTKEIMIKNMSRLNQDAGSHIIITQKNNNGKEHNLPITLWKIKNNKIADFKALSPQENITLSWPLNSIPVNNVTKAQLVLVTFLNDENTGKLILKRYEKKILVN